MVIILLLFFNKEKKRKFQQRKKKLTPKSTQKSKKSLKKVKVTKKVNLLRAFLSTFLSESTFFSTFLSEFTFLSTFLDDFPFFNAFWVLLGSNSYSILLFWVIWVFFSTFWSFTFLYLIEWLQIFEYFFEYFFETFGHSEPIWVKFLSLHIVHKNGYIFADVTTVLWPLKKWYDKKSKHPSWYFTP